MKYITIPEPVELYRLTGEPVAPDATPPGDDESDGDDTDAVAQVGPAKIEFPYFVLGRLADPKFGASMPGVLAAVEIKSQLDDANGFLALENEHWARLKDATETPSPQVAYHPQIAHCLLPFMQAICNASDKKPRRAASAPKVVPASKNPRARVRRSSRKKR